MFLLRGNDPRSRRSVVRADIARLMPGLRPARTGVLAFLFLVGGRRLRRVARRLIRLLKLDHRLNQLVLAQALQISPFHEDMDLEIGLPGKGARKSGASPDRRAENGGG